MAPVQNGGVFWSEDATWTLIKAWGSKFLELNCRNFQKTDWQFVAESVNAVHAFNAKSSRTDIQCKNRMDTVKKRFRIEKYKAIENVGTGFIPGWPFFRKMDELTGAMVAAKRVTPMGIPVDQTSALDATPVMVNLSMKRPGSTVARALASASAEVPVPPVDNSYFRRNYSTVAAAAAAEGEDGDDAEDSDSSEDEGSDGDGLAELARLARTIKKLGEMYERVERDRERLKARLEKQRMLFAKKMQIQRTQLLMDTQIQLQKIKRARRSRSK